MRIFTVSEDMTTEQMGKILQSHKANNVPILNKYKDYYDGKQAIMNKKYDDESKPCNHIVTNYCYSITHNYLGYILGLPVTYDVDDKIREVLNYNDLITSDNDVLTDMLIYGVAYELNYIDEDKQQRFRTITPITTIPVYDDTLSQNLLYVLRYYPVDELDLSKGFFVDVYSSTEVSTYKTNDSFASFELVKSEKHYFNQVPVTVYELNKDRVSIFDKVITLQDAYNTLLSDEVDDFEAFCDAYLALTGCDLESDDVAEMKKNRVLVLPEGATAQFLTKSTSDTQIENMLNNIKNNIHKISASPDFTDEKFLASSGIAMKFKLTGMENMASGIVNNMTKGLRKRLELIVGIVTILDSDFDWINCKIEFTRNLPQNDVETATLITQLDGKVSNATLISQLSFITDADEETKKAKEEKKESMESYAMRMSAGDDDDVLDE